jgi:hypothetical protein
MQVVLIEMSKRYLRKVILGGHGQQQRKLLVNRPEQKNVFVVIIYVAKRKQFRWGIILGEVGQQQRKLPVRKPGQKNGSVVYAKKQKQIQGIENAFVVKDDIESGYLNVIPLWEFGLLY